MRGDRVVDLDGEPRVWIGYKGRVCVRLIREEDKAEEIGWWVVERILESRERARDRDEIVTPP